VVPPPTVSKQAARMEKQVARLEEAFMASNDTHRDIYECVEEEVQEWIIEEWKENRLRLQRELPVVISFLFQCAINRKQQKDTTTNQHPVRAILRNVSLMICSRPT
jgi:hypothetical protein